MFSGFYKKTAAIIIACITVIMTSVFTVHHLLPEKYFISSCSELEYASSLGKIITFDTGTHYAKAVSGMQTGSFTATAKFMGIFPVKQVSVVYDDEKNVIACGTPFGVKMFTDGILIVGLSPVETKKGNVCPAAESGIQKGDILMAIDEKKVFTNEEVAEIIENCGGKSLDLLIDRDGEKIFVEVMPEMLSDQSGYKAGFWIRDSSAGIGTLTFYDPENLFFAGLGHAVCDVDTGKVIPFSSGEIVPASITGIKKGKSGSPGELGGTFIGNKNLGTVKINNETGLFGTLDYRINGTELPLAYKQDIYEGRAVILSTLDGTEPSEYEIEIEKVSLSDESLTKNMIIRVTDKNLLELTGGIVQGMSGSPIIQNGKLIGAVTHVLVNDPTRGYGIFIENMLDAAG